MSMELAQRTAGSPWRPSTTVKSSIGLHCAAGVGTLITPELWTWAVGAIAANHAFLTALGMWPRSTLLGPNIVRLPPASEQRSEIALTFDDGPDPEVTPRVLDLLDRHQAKATFFCVGEMAAAYPAIARDIVRRGHGLENHSHRHSPAFAFYGLAGLTRDVESAQTTLTGVAGRAPRFFRAPMGLRSPLLDPVLAKCGLHYVSWTRRGFDAIHRNPEKVLRRLADGLAAGDILLLHDGGTSNRAAGDNSVVLAVLPELLERIKAKGLKSVTLFAALGSGAAA
jgi:peptidoglycan/xylan/chitin deacetylase (PgdA/CDA1 family)